MNGMKGKFKHHISLINAYYMSTVWNLYIEDCQASFPAIWQFLGSELPIDLGRPRASKSSR